MHLSQTLLGLPASLVVLIATQLQAQQILPTAIKKMSLDEGEKIMPEHIGFAPEYTSLQSPLQARGLLTPEEELLLAANSSAVISYRPPFGVNVAGEALDLRNNGPSWRRAKEALHRLQGRDYSCPTNTASCESIGQPNYCCATGETCVEVENQPDSGNVGCCPDGQTCGGTVGPCGSGSTACAAEVGGGCCISGYVCAQVGCIASTVTVVTLTTTSSTVLSDSTAVTTVTTTASPSIITTTASTATSTSTTTTSTSTATATDTDTTSTSTGTALPPWRPTSGSDSNTITTTSADYCPTGFYACLATYGSGCCRTGRDCVTTSCPPVASTTITSNGATIVVAASDVPTTTGTSTCASGWFLCGTAAGPVAGCCPSGYACGTASCTLSASTATATVQKELPSSASRTMTTEIMSLVMGVTGLLVIYMM
ncbi:hypothetical protein E8E14_005357 [Neopestalotiopsis sp. 37M]|nr:hypothetical protein E8E14_005357 [Neopestalotiopsis sp. 37M]